MLVLTAVGRQRRDVLQGSSAFSSDLGESSARIGPKKATEVGELLVGRDSWTDMPGWASLSFRRQVKGVPRYGAKVQLNQSGYRRR